MFINAKIEVTEDIVGDFLIENQKESLDKVYSKCGETVMCKFFIRFMHYLEENKPSIFKSMMTLIAEKAGIKQQEAVKTESKASELKPGDTIFFKVQNLYDFSLTLFRTYSEPSSSKSGRWEKATVYKVDGDVLYIKLDSKELSGIPNMCSMLYEVHEYKKHLGRTIFPVR